MFDIDKAIHNVETSIGRKITEEEKQAIDGLRAIIGVFWKPQTQEDVEEMIKNSINTETGSQT